MRAILTLFAVVVVAACTHGGRPETGVRAQAKATEDEAKLAAALNGRIASLQNRVRSLEGDIAKLQEATSKK